MTKVLISESVMGDIADAIRSKTGGVELIKPINMPDEIDSIQVGIIPTGTKQITQNGLHDVTEYENVRVNVTSNVLSPSSISFAGSTISSIDLSNIDFTNTTDMGNMFENCSSLVSVSNINTTANTTSLGGMFWGCSNLESVDLSNFDTSECSVFSAMFLGCSKLTDLDLSGFTFENAEILNSMFQGCNSLTNDTIDDILVLCTTVTEKYARSKQLVLLGIGPEIISRVEVEALPHYQDFVAAGWDVGYY